jgi:2-amino-4-hydroxy-6-hydroxymethyldihydropteridine diphosphokinase
MDLWRPAYVGVGSNLRDPRSQVLRALSELADIPATRRIAVSRMYASRAFGPVTQPDFVNAVAGLLTQLDPRDLLKRLQSIEAAFGRPDPHPKWGPRIIDLDILVFAHERCNESDLILPHPGVVERNFVLYPLADIAPDLEVGGLGRVAELKARVGPADLRVLL